MKISDDTEEVVEAIREKNVLYITTKNLDYLRVQQEINLLKKYANQYEVIGFNHNTYFIRILCVYISLFLKKIGKYDVIFIGFMPQLIIPFFAYKFRKKVVIEDFFISIFDTLVDDRKKVNVHSRLSKLLYYIDHKTLLHSDMVIADTYAHASFFSKELGCDNSKLKVVYIVADTKYYKPIPIKKEEAYQNKFLVLYFGSILPVQGVEIILETIGMLSDKKDIHFLLIGPIEKKYHKVNSDTVTYIEWLSQEDLAYYIAQADLCLAGHFSGTIGKANRTIPGKAYIYQAMNKPMVLGKTEANMEVFNEDMDKIYYVETGNASELSKLITDIRDKMF